MMAAAGREAEEILARRRKREERREKQRRANVGRAQAMHELRIKAPADAAGPALFDETALKRTFYVGCSGWFYWHWKGGFYAEDLPTRNWFAYYSRQFHTVELNAPFYSWPTADTVRSWLRQIGRTDFVYTIKVCELITHTRKFRGTKRLVRDFGYIADLLDRRMGCLLFQLPPSFHYTPSRLGQILEQLEPERRNVVEFRHPSWWNDDVYKAFSARQIIFCSCSGPRLPALLVKTADEIYLRFHGPKTWYRHDYSDEELRTWAERAQRSGAKRVWAYFNNDRDCHAIKNARTFLKLLEQSEKVM